MLLCYYIQFSVFGYFKWRISVICFLLIELVELRWGIYNMNCLIETVLEHIYLKFITPFLPPCLRWLPQETSDSLRRYQTALAQSELTLCPVGINTECYRIYEACSYGSVPVVEDVLTPGTCAAGPSSPLRLLKAAGAPFIFISDWKELPAILERERGMSQEQRVDRRRRLLEWYASFRQQMKERFTEVIEETFFKSGWPRCFSNKTLKD